LISGLLFGEWKRSGSINLRRFYVRRELKIYPAFYFLIFVTVVINFVRPGIPSFPVTWQSVLAEATFTQNYFAGVWGQTWSLGVEEHFYILLPIALWLMYRTGKGSSDPFQKLPVLFMIVASAEIVLRMANARMLPPAASINAREAAYLFPTHLRIDALLFGVLIRYYREFQPAKFAEMAHSKAGLAIITFAALMVAAIPRENAVMYTVGFSLVLFGCGFLLARTVDAQPSRYLFTLLVRPLAATGYFSYSIYLWHGWIARLFPHATLLGFSLCLGASLLLGIAMAKLIEYPVLRARDRIFPAC
jgi:peptidoglycan/LPS O-acetylase OafA/YrhL